MVTLGDQLLGASYLNVLKLWNKYDVLSEKELEKIQNENLSKILTHTANTVPYYHFLKNKDCKLSDFPILTKEILRAEKEQLVSNRYSVEKLHKNFSSGSSGVQSYSYIEKKFKFYLQGVQTHWYMWSGYKIGDPVLQFGMSPNRIFPKNLKDIFYNVHYLNSFALDERKLLEVAKILMKKNIKYIIGYPSAINEFAKVLIKHQLNYKIEGVVSLGDKLFPHFRKNFNEGFKNPVIIDTYGCAEGILMASTCDLDYYYIMSPKVVIEIVDDNGNPVPDGSLGHVVVTSLTSFAMPLIRYKLGDLAIKLPKEKYPQKRRFNYPLLEKIVGRETDVVLTPNGKTLIVHSFTGIVEYYPQIKQFKIIQEVRELIVFEFITDEFFTFTSTVLDEIKSKIDALTDGSLAIEFKKVNYIKPTPSGKPQIIESRLNSIR